MTLHKNLIEWGKRQERKRVLQKIKELIDWGDQERMNNNIFRKEADELNTDWIEKIELLKQFLEEKE